MLRAGFGLKDAPRAWNMVFTKVLKDFGLETRFGKLKQEAWRFDHVGVMHEQDPETFEVTLHPTAYAA
eukprot:8084561-Lingulodinium_polyedra.AAC.1